MQQGARAALALLLVSLLVPLSLPLTEDAVAEEGDVTIATDEVVTWENGLRNITGRVSVYGTLQVRDYSLRYNATADGEASIWVFDGGSLEFDNVTLAPYNDSHYFVLKVEGTFVCRDSTLEHLAGSFATGGGVKCVDGAVELHRTRINDTQYGGQCLYVEGDGATGLVDNCTLEDTSYGIHVKAGGQVTVRDNTTIRDFKQAGVIVNTGEVDMTDCTVTGIRSSNSQGLAFRNAQVSVTDTVVSECTNEGIELVDQTSAYVKGGEVYNCTVGIRMSSSSADVWGVNIHDCLDGMNVYQSDPVVRECHITGNVNGISSKDCDPAYSLDGNTIGGNSQLGIYAVGNGLSETGTKWTDDTGEPNADARVVQIWLLDVNVTDRNGIAVIGAEVEISTAGDGAVYNGTTNSLGSVSAIELEGHRVTNDGTNQTKGAYTVHIKSGLQEADMDLLMDRGKEVTIVLGEVHRTDSDAMWWALGLIIVLIAAATVSYWWFRVR